MDNLEMFRNFYLRYPVLLDSENSDALRRKLTPPFVKSEISDAARGQLDWKPSRKIGHAVHGQSLPVGFDAAGLPIHHAARDESWQPGQLHSSLSWTHYRTLLRVESTDARGFYEIEAIQNNWSARELERQINPGAPGLFERLAKSKDKKG